MDGETPERYVGPTREEIDACDEPAYLARWYGELDRRTEELKAFVEGFRFTGTADPDWLHRAGGKLGYFRIAIRAIERRMLTLGLTVPYPPGDPRTREIRRLQQENDQLRRELAARITPDRIERIA